MKHLEDILIELISKGFCTPKISGLARKLKESPTTLHYNIKKMENEGKILDYKAVFNYNKINRGFCTYVFIQISPDNYSDPEPLAKELATFDEIESIDIITGDWEMIAKVRTKDIDTYYAFARTVLSRKWITKIVSFNSMKQIKTEFIQIKKC